MPPLSPEKPALCAGCGGKISDRYYLLAVDKQWHLRCLKCCECKLALESELTCFAKDGSIYCKEDYYRYSTLGVGVRSGPGDPPFGKDPKEPSAHPGRSCQAPERLGGSWSDDPEPVVVHMMINPSGCWLRATSKSSISQYLLAGSPMLIWGHVKIVDRGRFISSLWLWGFGRCEGAFQDLEF